MSVRALAKMLGKSWPAIEKADIAAQEKKEELQDLIKGKQIDSPDISFVVFGSLARREWTSGSDLDWTLLIDGQADHEHASTAQRLARLLKDAAFQSPGATQTFGTLTFSHDLIHQIGGPDDTNRNITKRLLLLLESTCIGNAEAHGRVITGILRRYLQNDLRPFRQKVPRFLLNDLHRYWRTICVDYASKYREQATDKWAVRNIKLALSRKLIFASGLIACFSADPVWSKKWDEQLHACPTVEGLVKHLRGFVSRTPLETLANAASLENAIGTAGILFDQYNEFLTRLDDPANRASLEKLSVDHATEEPIFENMQKVGDLFQDALERLFFNDSETLARLTRRFGVF